MPRDVFITDIAAFLPNNPVDNDTIEKVLGMAGEIPSRTRRIILRNNGIKQRYYAINPETGQTTHSNAQLTAEAVRRLKPMAGFSPDNIQCLCSGTSSPDQLFPGHGSMVHGELGSLPCEVVSTAGVCLSGASSLKYAFMSVAAGNTDNAVATGSELASTFIKAKHCGPTAIKNTSDLKKQPGLVFEADFLRWMLSDGAGAAFLSADRPVNKPALRIDWIELLSHAGSMETCMYAGGRKNEDGSLTGWREASSPEAAVTEGFMLIKQDAKLLNREIISTMVDRTLPDIIKRREITSEEITWFLPHYSSEYFRRELYDHLLAIGFPIPFDKWFSNLTTKGNTGAASIYIILEELFHSGRLKKGDRLLCFIPESGRFSIGYVLLTVV